MGNLEIIESVKKSLESNIGYSYSPEKLTEIVEAGIIPEGVFYNIGGQKMENINNMLIVTEDDKITGKYELEGDIKDSAMIMYASVACQK